MLKITFYPVESRIKEIKITLNDYKKLLTQLQKIISKTEQDIVQSGNRKRVEIGWQVGKILDEDLLKNSPKLIWD